MTPIFSFFITSMANLCGVPLASLRDSSVTELNLESRGVGVPGEIVLSNLIPAATGLTSLERRLIGINVTQVLEEGDHDADLVGPPLHSPGPWSPLRRHLFRRRGLPGDLGGILGHVLGAPATGLANCDGPRMHYRLISNRTNGPRRSPRDSPRVERMQELCMGEEQPRRAAPVAQRRGERIVVGAAAAAGHVRVRASVEWVGGPARDAEARRARELRFFYGEDKLCSCKTRGRVPGLTLGVYVLNTA